MMKDAGLRPNTYCMNSLMAVNVQARQPNTALEIFKEMERDGIPRDVVRNNFPSYKKSLLPPLLNHVVLFSSTLLNFAAFSQLSSMLSFLCMTPFFHLPGTCAGKKRKTMTVFAVVLTSYLASCLALLLPSHILPCVPNAGVIQHRNCRVRQIARRGGCGAAAAAGKAERHRAGPVLLQHRHLCARPQLPLAGGSNRRIQHPCVERCLRFSLREIFNVPGSWVGLSAMPLLSRLSHIHIGTFFSWYDTCMRFCKSTMQEGRPRSHRVFMSCTVLLRFTVGKR